VRNGCSTLGVAQPLLVEEDELQNVWLINALGNPQLLERAAHVSVYWRAEHFARVLAVHQYYVVPSLHEPPFCQMVAHGLAAQVLGIHADVIAFSLFSVYQLANGTQSRHFPCVGEREICLYFNALTAYLLIMAVVGTVILYMCYINHQNYDRTTV